MAGQEFILANIHEAKSGCWIWQGTHYPNGYGCCKTVFSKSSLAHRMAYEAWMGQIPEGRNLSRTCIRKNCCNPDHYTLKVLRKPTNKVAKKLAHSQRVEAEWLEYCRKMWALREEGAHKLDLHESI
jgi:hypothetical protein